MRLAHSLGRRVVSAILLVLATARGASAEIAEVYDLDSLAWMATDVIEADLIRLNEKITRPAEIRITAVHKGPRKAGETTRVYLLSGYRKPGEAFSRTKPLAPDDRLFLFLGPVPKENGLGVKGDPDARLVVPSGARLVQDDRAIPFLQFDSPGPVVAVSREHAPGLAVPTLAEFRRQTAAAIKAAERFAKAFEPPASPADVPWLLDVLRERSGKRDLGWRDKPAEAASARLANLHDIEALDAALFLRLPRTCRDMVERGFGCPEGRDFLLHQVADEAVPVDRRVRYAEVLRNGPREYHSVVGDIGPGGSGFKPPDVGDNAAYATRIARTARASDAIDVRLMLLEALARFSSGLPGRPDDDPIRNDLRDALPPLIELRRESTDERVRFGVERVVARVSRKAYDGLGSRCGPIVSLMTEERPPVAAPDGSRSLWFDYAIIPLDYEPTEPPVAVFTDLKTGRERIVPSKLEFRGRHEAVAGRGLALPRDLPAGRYRVSLRFSRAGEVVSDGYGFETEL